MNIMQVKQISLMVPVRGNWKYSVTFNEGERIDKSKPFEVSGQVTEISRTTDNLSIMLNSTLSELFALIPASDQKYKRLLIEVTYEAEKS